MKTIKTKIYNLYPPCYPNFKAIIDDLPRIINMGFNAIWLNPFVEVGIKTQVKRKFNGKNCKLSGSLYAATWEKDGKHYRLLQPLTFGLETNKAVKQVQILTKKMRDSKVTPMFDLVLNHISVDSPCFKDQNMKEFFHKKPHKLFDDTLGFDYKNEFTAKESGIKQNDKIFNNFWKNKIDWFIDVLGFRGVRVDCVAYTNPFMMKRAINYIRKKLSAKGIKKQNQIIFGEYIGDNEIQPNFPMAKLLKKIKKEEGALDFSHLMNCSNEIPSIVDIIGKNKTENLSAEINFKKTLMPSNYVGTIGAPGTHDRLPASVSCIETFKRHYHKEPTPTELLQLLKEKFLISAIGSDAGWFLMSGDEFGDTQIKSPPFLYTSPLSYNYENYIKHSIGKLGVKTNIDLQNFIRFINVNLIDKIIFPKDKPHNITFLRIANFFIAHGSFTYDGKNHIIIDLNTKY